MNPDLDPDGVGSASFHSPDRDRHPGHAEPIRIRIGINSNK